MSDSPSPLLPVNSSPTAGPDAASPERPQIVAPVWHTIVFIFMLVAFSAAGYVATRRLLPNAANPLTVSSKALYINYIFTLVFEWVLFFFVFWGRRLRGATPLLEQIYGKDGTARNIWRDIGIAALVWLTLLIVGGVTNFILKPTGGAVVAKLLPKSLPQLGIWFLICVSAGFCEEYIFRGYLQNQFHALTGSIWAGLVIQAAIFGLAHGYQGPALMVSIFFYGLVLGGAAQWFRSLRPVMIAHGWLDFLGGAAGFVLHLMHKI